MLRLVLIAMLLPCLACARYHAPIAFYPEETEQTESLYSNGVPFTYVNLDCANMLIALEQVNVGEQSYFRAYCLYRNLTSDRFLLYPHEMFRLTCTGGGEAIPPEPPMNPSEVTHQIEQERAEAQIGQLFLGLVQAATVQPTTVTGPGGAKWTIDDAQAKWDRIAESTANGMIVTSMSAEALKQRALSGILRRNTVFPGQEVGGFLYFDVPFHWKGDSAVPSDRVAEFAYLLSISTPCGQVQIRYNVVPGE